MCLENKLPILVFNFKKEGNIERAIAGEPIGTWVGHGPRPRAGDLGLSELRGQPVTKLAIRLD